MSNRLFQSIVHQMKDAIDRTIGVVDKNGCIIACSELVRIGENLEGVKEELAYTNESFRANGYTHHPINNHEKIEYVVFVEGTDAIADNLATILCISLTNIKHFTMKNTTRQALLKMSFWTTFFPVISISSPRSFT